MAAGVTDAGLVRLQGLKNLQWLCVGCRGVTQEGKEQLAALLPECKIRMVDPERVGVDFDFDIGDPPETTVSTPMLLDWRQWTLDNLRALWRDWGQRLTPRH